MDFPRTSQRVEKIGSLVLEEKPLGKILRFRAKQDNTLGTPVVLENPFVLRILLGVLFL